MINQSNLIAKESTTKENRIWIRISAACNEKCLFCLDSQAQDGKLIDEDIVKKQIRDGFRPWYTNRVILSWWEATINPKFPEYIAYAKSLGYDRIQTVTNGNMFAIPKFCDKVISLWLQEVTFSLHGHTAQLHDHLTATPWSFHKALKWLIYLRKYHPHVIINIDIVVNKVNVDFLPKIVSFYMKLWIKEFDILQIIPFGRGFAQYKDQLFYNISEHIGALHDTWKLSTLPWVYMWTNRFPAEAFEWFEDLIQDPRKIKSETMGESIEMFDPFIRSQWRKKPECFGDACDVCFLKQYCHEFIASVDSISVPMINPFIIWSDDIQKIDTHNYVVLRWEEFPSEVYKKYGTTPQNFLEFIQNMELKGHQKLVNIPPCIRSKNNSVLYEDYNNLKKEYCVEDYTSNYIKNLYRKKSISCKKCKFNDTCKGIHINFIRAYGFEILHPIE